MDSRDADSQGVTHAQHLRLVRAIFRFNILVDSNRETSNWDDQSHDHHGQSHEPPTKEIVAFVLERVPAYMEMNNGQA